MCIFEEGEFIRPLGFNVLVKVDGEEQVTSGGIVLQAADERTKRGATKGTVIAVGPLAGKDPGNKPEYWGAVVGNVVFFEAYEGQYYQGPKGESYLMIPEKDITGELIKVEHGV
jgi:co-chaperonin GroES (HSP10)